MNRLIALIFLCAFLIPNAFAGGIEFQRKGLKELLSQAKAENKILFIDAYTTWCGPCKMMDREVFTDPKVSEFFNKHFVNAKFDMDRGSSTKVKYDYGVQAYPTLLFIDGDGDLIKSVVGGRPADYFLSEAKEINKRESAGQLIKRFAKGERDPEFLLKYFDMRILLGEGNKIKNEISAYLETQDNLATNENFSLLLHAPGDPDGRRMRTLTEYGNAVMENFSTAAYMEIIQTSFVNFVRKEHQSTDLPSLERMKDLYVFYGGDLKERLSYHYPYLSAKKGDNLDKLIESAEDYLSRYPSNDVGEIHEFTTRILNESKSEKHLNTALKYTLRSVPLAPENWSSFALLSKIYKALGQKDKAKTTLEKAEKLGATKKMLKDYK